jgi:hypothetical protein
VLQYKPSEEIYRGRRKGGPYKWKLQFLRNHLEWRWKVNMLLRYRRNNCERHRKKNRKQIQAWICFLFFFLCLSELLRGDIEGKKVCAAIS